MRAIILSALAGAGLLLAAAPSAEAGHWKKRRRCRPPVRVCRPVPEPVVCAPPARAAYGVYQEETYYRVERPPVAPPCPPQPAPPHAAYEEEAYDGYEVEQAPVAAPPAPCPPRRHVRPGFGLKVNIRIGARGMLPPLPPLPLCP